MKLDDVIATLQETLLANGVPKDTVSKVIRDLQKAQEEEKADRTPAKKSKSQFAILVSDPEGRLKGMELVGWVVQMEEEASPTQAYERVVTAANHFNSTKRGRKLPLNTLGEAMQVLRGKFLKRDNPLEKTAIKTRHPVAIQPVKNELGG